VNIWIEKISVYISNWLSIYVSFEFAFQFENPIPHHVFLQ
jgi:hypothetical protein